MKAAECKTEVGKGNLNTDEINTWKESISFFFSLTQESTVFCASHICNFHMVCGTVLVTKPYFLLKNCCFLIPGEILEDIPRIGKATFLLVFQINTERSWRNAEHIIVTFPR